MSILDTPFYSFDYRLRKRASLGAAVALLALSEDATLESDLRHYLPVDADLYTGRVPCEATITNDSLAAMGDQLSEALTNLVPNSVVDLVAYGCTSGSMVLGQEAIESAVHAYRQGVPVTNPLLAAQTLLRSRRIQRLAVLVPYERELGLRVGRALSENTQCKLVAVGSFECLRDPEVVRIDASSITRAAKSLLKSHPADALFVSCTSFRVAGLVESLESELGVAVMASNQALAWHINKLIVSE